jgi:hypothetical protein
MDGLIPPHRCGERGEDGSFDLRVVAGEREGAAASSVFKAKRTIARRLIV